MLNAYISRTYKLLQNPSPAQGLYSTSDLTDYINRARIRTASDGRCIRVRTTLPTVVGQQQYQFTGLNTGNPDTTGIKGVLHCRSFLYGVGADDAGNPIGYKRIGPRAWEWFELYYLNNPVPVAGPPTSWAQYAQGGAAFGGTSEPVASGSFFLNPVPDAIYSLIIDCVCYPIPLLTDTDVEAIPIIWNDAVCYYAAYLALLSSQTSTRQADANRMHEAYEDNLQRARNAANPDLNTYLFEQGPDLTLPGKLGLQTGGAGAQ